MLEPLCVAFNRGCVDGQRPQIESFVATVERSRQPVLLAQLLTIEVEYRRSIGEQPKIEEYTSRFPDQRAILDAVWLDTDHASRPTATTKDFRPAPSADPNPAASQALSATMEFGRYSLIEKLGSGGAGEVWRALDPLLGRHVAIKILRSDRPQHAEWMQQLQAEARKMADLDLSLPGIVRVLDVGTTRGSFFIVSQLVEGGSLARRMAGPPMSHRDAAELVAAAAEAIHHVHLKGLTHRDLKPGNILLDNAGRPHIADFGLAVSEEDQLQEEASTVGTAAYMAPEQARGQSNRVDARTDIWALGVILYELLCRRLPFKASAREVLYEEILHREARPPRTIDDSIPLELERICLKCLSKPIGERYTSSRDLALDLRRWLEPASAPVQPSSRPRRIWPAVAAACAIALILVGWSFVRTQWHHSDVPPDKLRGEVAVNDLPAKPRGADNAELPSPVAVPVPQQNSNALFRPLISSLGAKDLLLRTLAERTGLRVESSAAELISLGQIDAVDDEVEIALNQVPWTGDIGLFFGYRLGVLGDDELHVFQALVLKPGDDAWRLIRIRYSYPDAAPGEWSGKNLSSVEFPRPGKDPIRLRVRFDRRSLAEVAIDGVSKPELCDTPPASGTSSSSSAGQLGLLLNHSKGVVSSLSLNGTRQLFVAAE